MTQNKDKIVVAACTDDTYAQHLGVMLCSLFENNSAKKNGSSQFKIYVVDGGIHPENISKLSQLESKYHFTIHYLKPNENLFKDAPITGHISMSAYHRLQLAELVPKHVEKILYLDCDTIILGQLEKIWNIDMGSNTIAAVADPWAQGHMKIKLPEGRKTFNSGVLLINTGLWRSQNVTKACLECIAENYHNIVLWDQDVLNIVFQKKWLPLPLAFNFMVSFYIYPGTNYYTKEEIAEAKENPVIIHFISSPKPWDYFCNIPLKKKYWEYLRQTPWKGFYFEYINYRTIKKYYIERYVPEIIRDYYMSMKRRIVSLYFSI